MSVVRGYNEFLSSLNEDLKKGVLADTNVLISATYDLDPANEQAVVFFDLLAEHEVPIFCNVNVKSEFLEIHRRIIFTEALLDFESQVDKSKLPSDLTRKLNSIRTQAEKRTKQGKLPLRLPEAEIKDFKMKMSEITDESRDLWTALCEDRVINKLSAVWNEAETELGLNFLSTRREDQSVYFEGSPTWEGAMALMESYGLSSSDAMIINMFMCSKFIAMVTSDLDVAHSIKKIGNKAKVVFLPDNLAERFT
jgi:predicted nucleic acid-binding protein